MHLLLVAMHTLDPLLWFRLCTIRQFEKRSDDPSAFAADNQNPQDEGAAEKTPACPDPERPAAEERAGLEAKGFSCLSLFDNVLDMKAYHALD